MGTIQPPLPTRLSRPTKLKKVPENHNSLLVSVSALLGVGFLGGFGACVGAWVSGHWAAVLAGAFLGLGSAAAASCSLLLTYAAHASPKAPPSPPEDLWLSDHERWDRIYDRLARSPRLVRAAKVKGKRQRPKSRPPLSR
jgi:hypothetical protein